MEILLSLLGKLPVFALLLLAAIATVAGDYFGKLWSVDLRHAYFWIGFVLYALAGLFYFPTLLRDGLITTSIVWTILATAGFLIIGLLIFKEQLTLLQWIGVGFGIVAIILINW